MASMLAAAAAAEIFCDGSSFREGEKEEWVDNMYVCMHASIGRSVGRSTGLVLFVSSSSSSYIKNNLSHARV